MQYNKKKLYESIMREVKKALNELSSQTYNNAVINLQKRFDDDEYIANTPNDKLLHQWKRIESFKNAANAAKEREDNAELLKSFDSRRAKVLRLRNFDSEIKPILDNFLKNVFTKNIVELEFSKIADNFNYKRYDVDIKDINEDIYSTLMRAVLNHLLYNIYITQRKRDTNIGIDDDYVLYPENIIGEDYYDDAIKYLYCEQDAYLNEIISHKICILINDIFCLKWDGQKVHCQFWDKVDGETFKYYLPLPDDGEINRVIRKWYSTNAVYDYCNTCSYSDYIGIFSNSKDELNRLITDLCEETGRSWEMPNTSEIIALGKKPRILWKYDCFTDI